MADPFYLIDSLDDRGYRLQVWQDGVELTVRVEAPDGRNREERLRPEYPTRWGLDVVDSLRCAEVGERLARELEESQA